MTSQTCSSGCKTKDHASYSECLRSKSTKVAYCGYKGSDATVQKKWDAELDLYRSAVAQGIEPDTTKTKDSLRALEWSNKNGKPYSEPAAHQVNVEKAMERIE